jgi:tRNA pseudouridine(38-40) synthase
MTLFEGDEGPARVKLVVAYDGTGFHGWAEQPEVRTVEGVLTRALERFLRHPPERLTCAGRTDAGVHAWGQVVSFDADAGVDPSRLQSAVNGALAPEVVVRTADVVEPDFDARRSACWRTYRYTVVNRPVTDPFLARYAWWVPTALDVRALRLGADPFVGEHDFAAFCRQGPEGSTTISGTACCATTSAPPRSAGRWCDRSSGRSSRSGRARSVPVTSWGSSAPRTAPTPANPRHPRGSACGRSATSSFPVAGATRR